ncbi:MAG: leucyl/phenylalanyl-tRNA--protein transferase, partial [Nitrospiraceae bacterium]
TLVQQLIKWNFTLIDCQVTTAHLKSLGAQDVPRDDFLLMLKSALNLPTKKGKWVVL